MGIYADPALYDWFTKAYAKSGHGQTGYGQSRIRFLRNPEDIPYDPIGELCAKNDPQTDQKYESMLKKSIVNIIYVRKAYL